MRFVIPRQEGCAASDGVCCNGYSCGLGEFCSSSNGNGGCCPGPNLIFCSTSVGCAAPTQGESCCDSGICPDGQYCSPDGKSCLSRVMPVAVSPSSSASVLSISSQQTAAFSASMASTLSASSAQLTKFTTSAVPTTSIATAKPSPTTSIAGSQHPVIAPGQSMTTTSASPTSSPSTKHHGLAHAQKRGIIVGSVVGGLLLVALIICCLVSRRNKGRKPLKSKGSTSSRTNSSTTGSLKDSYARDRYAAGAGAGPRSDAIDSTKPGMRTASQNPPLTSRDRSGGDESGQALLTDEDTTPVATPKATRIRWNRNTMATLPRVSP